MQNKHKRALAIVALIAIIALVIGSVAPVMTSLNP